MAKAFTEEEKTTIREKIMETALDLFHDQGTKSLNISELTKRVGIAQGSFYNFWKNKESLVIDLVSYRSKQKLDRIEKEFPHSLRDPRDFLSDTIYKYSVDLMRKVETQPIYKDAFNLFKKIGVDEIQEVEKLYGEFLERLVQYWRQHSVVKHVDVQGLSHAIIGSFVLCYEHHHFQKNYFEEVLQTFISSMVTKYIEM